MEIPQIRYFSDGDVKHAIGNVSVFQPFFDDLRRHVADRHRLSAGTVDLRNLAGIKRFAQNLFAAVALQKRIGDQLKDPFLLCFIVRLRQFLSQIAVRIHAVDGDGAYRVQIKSGFSNALIIFSIGAAAGLWYNKSQYEKHCENAPDHTVA